ncbi:hypothetical protein PMAYCL1PPCAC_28993, partial [Pristionchus mayeri]
IFCSSAAMAVSEANYIELMKNCSKFNARITVERQTRYPFFDQQTGTAHRPSIYAWRKSEHRSVSTDPDYVYVYPAVKWSRDPAAPPSDATEMKMFLHNNQPLNEAINQASNYGGGLPMSAAMPSSMGNLEARALMSSAESSMDTSMSGEGRRNAAKREAAYDDYDEDPLDLSDEGGDSDDDFGAKKKKGKGGPSAKKKASGAVPSMGASSYAPPSMPPSEEKKHACNSESHARYKAYAVAECGARYKSRPGLSYHKAHVHGDGVQAPANVLAGGGCLIADSSSSRGRNRRTIPPPIQIPSVGGGGGAASPAVLPPPVIFSPSVDISDTCDFCDGTRLGNKKTKKPEELVTCHDCGRSAHPSCLKFTENMRVSTSKFGWQCIECKSCAICGTSDNDDKLLFCDDCDRGFHLYCLQPPLEEAPDDSWSCHLCTKVFGSKAAAAQAKK